VDVMLRRQLLLLVADILCAYSTSGFCCSCRCGASFRGCKNNDVVDVISRIQQLLRVADTE
jgi:hypothetical protein